GPGEPEKVITVHVTGDPADEPVEAFLVNLSGISGVAAGRTQAVGYVLNDDQGGWQSFAGDAQHMAVSPVPAQDMDAVHWQAAIDDYSTSRAAHYGSPVITAKN